jgi:hypothetical protein
LIRLVSAGLLSRCLGGLLAALLLAMPLVAAAPAFASLDNDRYDGNIFALYAGNGSLVPPRSTLAEALSADRVSVLVFYLDDSAVSKRFSPVVSELQRTWGNAVEIIPLVTDPLQNRPKQGAADPARYWKGEIPQVVVLDGDGKVAFDATGQVEVGAIDSALSRVTGIPLPPERLSSATVELNELNAEIPTRR